MMTFGLKSGGAGIGMVIYGEMVAALDMTDYEVALEDQDYTVELDDKDYAVVLENEDYTVEICAE